MEKNDSKNTKNVNKLFLLLLDRNFENNIHNNSKHIGEDFRHRV